MTTDQKLGPSTISWVWPQDTRKTILDVEAEFWCVPCAEKLQKSGKKCVRESVRAFICAQSHYWKDPKTCDTWRNDYFACSNKAKKELEAAKIQQ